MTLPSRGLRRGMSLIELLCVIGIIGVLLAMYLPAVGRALVHAKHVLFGD